MAADELDYRERVVKLQEVYEGQLVRTFYCIYDFNYRHWMSNAPFDGELWTKDLRCRREFHTRREAKGTLKALRKWREEREQEAEHLLAVFPPEREAA